VADELLEVVAKDEKNVASRLEFKIVGN